MNLSLRLASVIFCALSTLVACSSDDAASSSSSGSSSGGSSSGASSSGSSGGAGCTGDVTACAIGSLSASQHEDFCNTLLTTIDDPPGTKYECTSGPLQGQQLTLNDKATCIAQPAPKTCKAKVKQLIDCYKAAKQDPCAAFADGGACAAVFGAEGCSGS